MAASKRLIIFGSGLLAEIAGYYFASDSEYDVVGFTDDADFLQGRSNVNGKPLSAWSETKSQFEPTQIEFFVAIGYRQTNAVRERRYREIKALGYNCATYISSRATNFSTSIGDNCFILENNVLQPFTRIGNNVYMWSGNHLGHHSVVDDNVFLSSHVVISGNCRIGRNCFLGVNCCLFDGVEVGEKSVIGAGSIVGNSCPPRSVFAAAKTKSRTIEKDII